MVQGYMLGLNKEIQILNKRIGIPNKGEWTTKPLRFTVKGNPYVSRMKKSEMDNPDLTWRM